jgi:hypothetical protein
MSGQTGYLLVTTDEKMPFSTGPKDTSYYWLVWVVKNDILCRIRATLHHLVVVWGFGAKPSVLLGFSTAGGTNFFWPLNIL